MSVRGLTGAASAATALRRLDRLGHVPVALLGPGPLDDLTGRPPAALVAEGPDATGEAALADALALLEAPRGVAPAADSPVKRAVAARSPSLPGLRRAAVPPEVAAALPSRRPRARRFDADPQSGRPHAAWPAAVEAPATGWSALPLPPRGAAAASGTARPAPAPALSRPARVGAATPVGLPAVRVRPGSGPGSASRPEPGVAFAGPGVAPAATPTRAATAAALDDRRGGPPHLRRAVAAGIARSDPARPGPTSEVDLPQQPSPAPANGLTGLVSWWDAQTATRDVAVGVGGVGEVSGVPAVTGPAVAWSAAGPPAHEGAARAAGALEGSLAARLSLRGALEDLLLAEARASGIEVLP